MVIGRIALALVITLAATLPAAAQQTSLDDLIIRYETFAGDERAPAGSLGDPALRSTWPDVTPSFVADRAETAAALLAELDTIDPATRQTDVAILRHLLQTPIDDQRFDTYRIPFTGDWGFHAEPHFAALQTRLDTRAQADAWIARVEDVPRYYAENITNMRRGMATGWTAHQAPLATVIDQVRGQIIDDITQSALYLPLTTLPADMNPREAADLRASALIAVSNAMAAYRNLRTFLETEYAPAARQAPGLNFLPGGETAYRAAIAHHTAGSGLSPEQIHQIGLAEVTRIRLQMSAAMIEAGFTGNLDAFINFLRTDPRFHADSAEDLLEKASEIAKRLDATLPDYFGLLPRLTYGVEPVPAEIAPGYTTGRYAPGDMRARRAGKFLVNTYRLDQRPLYELPALAAHEAVPGHHLQIALAQELGDMPDFRKSFYATAFGEGWGLYAEKLAGEAGIYRTPYEKFGQLSYEMWRACRLVADTGLHLYGWTRPEAEACFIDNTALSALNIETEVTRYIGWPGQATAYKVGELKILELRGRAQLALGEGFDLRAFHDHLLGAGSMPLDALDARMTAWIAAQQAGTGRSAPRMNESANP